MLNQMGKKITLKIFVNLNLCDALDIEKKKQSQVFIANNKLFAILSLMPI